MHKYLLTLSIVMALFAPVSLFSQNLVLNGGMENWDNNTTPTDWDKAESVFQDGNTVHGGTYSAKHVSGDGTLDLQQNVEGVIGGANYTITYFYYDNDPMARTRIWSYWLQGDQTLDADADILRPDTYSTDNPDWIEWSHNLTAPQAADGFRFEVRVYKQDGSFGGSVYYDDFSMVSSGALPEPTNYPTGFTSATSGLNVNLEWTDAVGGQLPGAYLILASNENNIVAPVDGTYVSDDENLADGSGALNIPYGEQTASFANLNGQTTYYFKIFPYTNGGTSTDYKTDGEPPYSSSSTGNYQVLLTIDFNESWQNCATVSVTGAQIWDRDNTYGLEFTPCARMSGYSGGSFENDDWLITPPINTLQTQGEMLSFFNAKNYTGPDMQVKISTDYDGGGDPYSANWTTLTFNPSPGFWEWTSSGDIDISAFNAANVFVAFQYTSNSSEAATWEVDDIMVLGTSPVSVDEINEELNIRIYPVPADDELFIKSSIIQGHYSLSDLTGRLVMEGALEQDMSLNVSYLQDGLYLLRISDEISARGQTIKVVVR